MTRIDELHDKAVLITGASPGIGAAVTRAFAAQGARLALHFNGLSGYFTGNMILVNGGMYMP